MALAGANEGQKTYSGSSLFRLAVQILNNYQIGNLSLSFLSSLGIYSFLCDVELKKNILW